MREYAYIYEKGKRNKNEDSILVEKMQTDYGEVTMAVVCDGIGGMQRGEIASGYIVEQCGIWFYESLPKLIRHIGSSKVEQSFHKLCYQMHNSLKDYGVRRSIHLGSTMSALLCVGHETLLFHYGDSAIYKVYPRAKRLTKKHGGSEGLTRCLGLGKFTYPDTRKIFVKRNEGYLLCTDGLLQLFSEGDFHEILGDGKNAKRKLDTLGKVAIRRGAKDNISAIYLKV